MSGWGNSIVISVGDSIAVSVPRRQLLESTLNRRVRPRGSVARQSVKVPPVSTQTRQLGLEASTTGTLTGESYGAGGAVSSNLWIHELLDTWP